MLWTNVHSAEHCSVCLIESVPLQKSEATLLRNGLFVWFGILSEKASTALDESSFRSFGGRALKCSTSILSNKSGFAPFLKLLDEVDDVVTHHISSVSDEFKARPLYNELRRCLSDGSPELWRLCSPVFSALLQGDLTADTVAFFRQLGNLLSKVSVARNDLLSESYSSYKSDEQLFFIETTVQRVRDPLYWDLVLSVRREIQCVIDSFEFDPRLVRHGPGAVSIPRVKGRTQKYLNMSYDSRIDYLLKKGSYGSMGEYSPFELLGQDRTSRVIYVPKTWKKLRGISAEPVGLQFFQQGIFRSINKALRKTRLRNVIDLHSQDKSRALARKASRDGKLCTIDLSSASDSVTLQLVKDIFGASDLCRWLLATRSTHTLVNNERLEISKFAPMGSACCFPVECLIFAGVVLATAAKRFGNTECFSLRNYQVFGDDIICPSCISQDVIDNLVTLGFTVNTEKSFVTGYFRESCGMDAWRGHDVTPLKLKDFSLDFNGSVPCSYEHHSRVVSYLNGLYFRGYHRVRSFLLEKFLNCEIFLKREVFHVRDATLFGEGSHGDVYSPIPTNFVLDQPLIRGYHRHGYRMVIWRPRKRQLAIEDELLDDAVGYLEYLRTMSSDTATLTSYDPRFFLSIRDNVKVDSRCSQMIPSFKVVDPINWGPPNKSWLLKTLSF